MYSLCHRGIEFVNPKNKRFSYGFNREKSMVKIRAGIRAGSGQD
jgi:hypothetical protein